MLKYNIIIAFVLVLGVAAISFTQFATPTLYDADGYLHIRMTEFLKDLGPRYNFHWARFSTFNGTFADKDFLYHAILIPFTFFKNIFFGVKIAAVISAVLLFLGFYLLLKKYAGKRLIPFMLLCFLFSASFLETINSPRPLTLVILINLLAIHLIIRKRYAWIFLTGIVYALIHVTSPLIICYAFIIELVRHFDRKEFHFKTIFFSFLGVLIGFCVHPNFPNNFIIFYLNSILVPVYTIKTGVLELGAEFFPLNTRDYLLKYPVVLIGIVSMIYIAISRAIKVRFETKAFLAIGAIFLGLSFMSQRYLSHGYLIMLMGFACYASDSSLAQAGLKKSGKALITILIIALAWNSFNGILYNGLVAKIINGHYEAAGAWMAKNIPEKELIFHANWSDSQYFIGMNPKDDYFVTLDPVYMYNKNPELYKLYRDVAFGRTQDPYGVLKNTFNASYGYAGKNYFSGLVNQVRKDSRFVILAEDQFGVIFKLN